MSGLKDYINKKMQYFWHVQVRCLPFNYQIRPGRRNSSDIKIVGMIRERNESLLLKDTLDHLARFVDALIVFDDASDDDSVSIALKHPSVAEVIINKQWKKSGRVWEETANRKKLHQRAKKLRPEWFFYADADERFEGNIREYLLEDCPDSISGIKISLFDSYITKNDAQPYMATQKLFNFRKYFGPERRDILMIWRNGRGADFLIPDAREPQNVSPKETETRFYCQHYGKSLSIQHWEDTCKYYADHFPKYSEKWRARMGKAVHDKSDFGAPLMGWDDVKAHGVAMK